MINEAINKRFNRVVANTEEVLMNHDVSFFNASFSSTSVEVKALTEKALSFFSEMFGAGAVSVELPKSKAADFSVFINQKGLTSEWV